MEMPEGWESLQEDANKLQQEFGKYYDLEIGVGEALMLMKEMAEVLDRYAAVEEYQDEDSKFEIPNDAEKVLIKFREWK